MPGALDGHDVQDRLRDTCKRLALGFLSASYGYRPFLLLGIGQSAGRCQNPSWYRIHHPPDDTNGLTSAVALVNNRPKEVEGLGSSIPIRVFANKQQDVRSHFNVVEIARGSFRSNKSITLRLPMEQGISDRVVIEQKRQREEQHRQNLCIEQHVGLDMREVSN